MRVKKRATTAGVGLLTISSLIASVIASGGQVAKSEAASVFQWDAIQGGDPIPAWMPASQSADPAAAGFARQWVERALSPADLPERQLALAIVALHRDPSDAWAGAMEAQLRRLIDEEYSTKAPIVSRVFCNSVGCLCYIEAKDRALKDRTLNEASMYNVLVSKRGKALGLTRQDLDVVRATGPDIGVYRWELTAIRRPKAK